MIVCSKAIRQQLCEQRDTLIKRIEDESKNLSRRTDRDADPVDRALRETTQVRQLALIAQARWQVERIQTCLHRLQENLYGVCVQCGNRINPERLIAIPYATLCVKCQSKQDETRRN